MIQPIIEDSVIERLRSLINGVKNVVITCHLSPDGDAIGSSLALCHVLHRLGKNAMVVTPDMVPRTLSFLPDMRDMVVFTKNEARARGLVEQAQLFFCLDFNDMRRIDKLGELIMQQRGPRVLIDHHLEPQPVFDVVMSFPELSSTCELVFRLLMQLHMLNLIDRYAAQCLYIGMMTDTGNFTYSCENPELYEIQSLLMRRHINKQRLYNLAMNTFSADSLRLQGYALSQKMELFPEHGAALITLTHDDLKQYNYRKGDTEGLVNKPLAIPGIHWVVFFRQDPEYVKVSCRSQGDFSVNDICRNYFNGGGHINAAGGEFYGTMEQAVQVFHRILDERIPKQENEETKQ
ncbi:MAG: bifunctional oligoribonuclease/PAP phosphatase NrnA [Muribaculaceae bacterium]|nr:bifunctional oligoribonuclease/PAP phosphatase NrnA [Muribaculaceae bacterium]